MKTTLRRLQQLEQRHSELTAADHSSGARERILNKIRAMADPRLGNPDLEAPTFEEVKARLEEVLSIYRGEVTG